MFYATIIADSITRRGHRLTSYECQYPRFILAEVNTHRMLSRNSPSSRAIPANRLRMNILEDPVIPVCWPKNQAGMQATQYLDSTSAMCAEEIWKNARNMAARQHECLENCGVHKQIANRVIEPWLWTRSLLTATHWTNFFKLRVNKDAQPEFQMLAYLMLKAYLRSQPVVVEYDDWHTPYGDKEMPNCVGGMGRAQVTTGRAARVSYRNQNGHYSVEDDIKLHDRVLGRRHLSPLEHAAQAVDTDEFFGNFQGWKQYRKTIPEEDGTDVDLVQLLKEYEATMPDFVRQS